MAVINIAVPGLKTRMLPALTKIWKSVAGVDVLGFEAERFSTRFHVTGTFDASGPHTSAGTDNQRLIAEQGRNGLYRVSKQTERHDNYGGVAGGQSTGFLRDLVAYAFGYPKGDLIREDAIRQLAEFERDYPDLSRDVPVKDTIPHYTTATPA